MKLVTVFLRKCIGLGSTVFPVLCISIVCLCFGCTYNSEQPINQPKVAKVNTADFDLLVFEDVDINARKQLVGFYDIGDRKIFTRLFNGKSLELYQISFADTNRIKKAKWKKTIELSKAYSYILPSPDGYWGFNFPSPIIEKLDTLGNLVMAIDIQSLFPERQSRSYYLYPNLSASRRPHIYQNQLFVCLSAKSIEEKNRYWMDTIANAPLSLKLDLKSMESQLFGSYSLTSLDLDHLPFNGLELSCSLVGIDSNRAILSFAKEHEYYEVKFGDEVIVDKISSPVANNTSFLKAIRSNQDVQEYLTHASYYKKTFYSIPTNTFIRVLKLAAAEDSQKGQTETPWQLVLHALDNSDRSTQILEFEGNAFDFSDIHLLDHYILVSNRALHNEHRQLYHHSYTIIDLNNLDIQLL